MQKPLAYRMRPKKIDEIVGQQDLVGPGASITKRLSNPQSITSFFSNWE